MNSLFVTNCPDNMLLDMNIGNGCPPVIIIPFTSNESFAFVKQTLRALALDRPTGPGIVHLVCTRLHIVGLLGEACLQFTYIRGRHRPTVHNLMMCTSTGCGEGPGCGCTQQPTNQREKD